MKIKTKNILIVSTAPTHPTISGNRSAIISYTNLLKKMGYDVSFLFVQTSNSSDELNKTRNYWGDNFFHFKTGKFYYRKKRFYKWLFEKHRKSYQPDNWYPNGLSRFVKKIVKQNDFNEIIVNYIWLTKIFNVIKDVKKIIFTHDVFSNRYHRTGLMWFSTTPQGEALALNRCDVVLAIQDLEKYYFDCITNSNVITTYSPVEYHETKICGNKNILFFSGPNDHNTEGLINFLDNHWELIKKEIPEINLIVGGKICNRDEINNYRNSIELIGEVENPTDFYSKGDVFINPVFEGTGLKIKNMEAMAHGKITVCHPHNVEGIFKQNEAPLFRAVNSEEYLKAFEKIFNSVEFCKKTKIEIADYINDYNNVVEMRFKEALK